LYDNGLRDIPQVALPNFADSNYYDSYQNYVIRTAHRDALRQHLKDAGVETLVHWVKAMWQHAGLKLENPSLPETESLCREVLSLPMSAETTKEQVEITVEAIHEFFASNQSDALSESLVRSTA